MSKKSLSITLIATLFLSLLNASLVFGKGDPAARIAKIKAGIAKLGTGEQARITVKLHDKTTLSGYISEAGAESFIIADLQTDTKTTIAYPDVRQVKGKNLTTGSKVGIGIAIGVGVGLLVAWLVFQSLDS